MFEFFKVVEESSQGERFVFKEGGIFKKRGEIFFKRARQQLADTSITLGPDLFTFNWRHFSRNSFKN